MIRETVVPLKLLVFEDRDAFLKNNDPKRVRQIVIKSQNGVIKFGHKIELERGDLIIITAKLNEKILISVSSYIGFGKFEEKYFEIAETTKIEKFEGETLNEKEIQILKTNIAALKATA